MPDVFLFSLSSRHFVLYHFLTLFSYLFHFWNEKKHRFKTAFQTEKKKTTKQTCCPSLPICVEFASFPTCFDCTHTNLCHATKDTFTRLGQHTFGTINFRAIAQAVWLSQVLLGLRQNNSSTWWLIPKTTSTNDQVFCCFALHRSFLLCHLGNSVDLLYCTSTVRRFTALHFDGQFHCNLQLCNKTSTFTSEVIFLTWINDNITNKNLHFSYQRHWFVHLYLIIPSNCMSSLS